VSQDHEWARRKHARHLLGGERLRDGEEGPCAIDLVGRQPEHRQHPIGADERVPRPDGAVERVDTVGVNSRHATVLVDAPPRFEQHATKAGAAAVGIDAERAVEANGAVKVGAAEDRRDGVARVVRAGVAEPLPRRVLRADAPGPTS
jgi:hypothetical protein